MKARKQESNYARKQASALLTPNVTVGHQRTPCCVLQELDQQAKQLVSCLRQSVGTCRVQEPSTFHTARTACRL